MQRWQSKTRYYQVVVQRDLFGQWEVMRVWGRIGSALGRQMSTHCASHADALVVLNAIAKVRARRGYVLMP